MTALCVARTVVRMTVAIVIMGALNGCASVRNWMVRSLSGLRSPVYVTHSDMHVYYVEDNYQVPPKGLTHRITIKSNLIYRVVHREDGIKYLRTIPQVAAQVVNGDTVIVNKDKSIKTLADNELQRAKAQREKAAERVRKTTAAEAKALGAAKALALTAQGEATASFTEWADKVKSAENKELQAPLASSLEKLAAALDQLSAQDATLAMRIARYSTLGTPAAALSAEQQLLDDIISSRVSVNTDIQTFTSPLTAFTALPAPTGPLTNVLTAVSQSNRRTTALRAVSLSRFVVPANVDRARYQSLADTVISFTNELRIKSSTLSAKLTGSGGAAKLTLKELVDNPQPLDELAEQAQKLIQATNLLMTLLSGRATAAFSSQQRGSLPQLQDVNDWLLAVEETHLPDYSHVLVYGVDWGALVIPFKVRPRTTKRNPYTGQVLHYSPEFSSDFTAGTMLAYRFRLARKSSTFNSFASLGLGFGATNIDYVVGETAISAPTTSSGAPERQNRWGATVCVPFTMQLDRFNLGVAVGWDFLYGEAARTWVYQGKPWVGLGFGVSFLQGEKWQRE
jgi:hypothetical protein